jgi:hypothetical protein
VIRRVVIGALLLVMVAASPAAAQYDDFTITPGSVQPGGTVTVTGQGCSPGAEVTITLTEGDTSAAKAAGDVIATTTVTADEDGRFNTTITVPAGTPAGVYSVDATCDGVLVGHAVIDVLDATAAPNTGAGASGPIVRTGSDLTGLGMIGAALLTVGGIVLIATRSRRHAAA